MRGSERLGDVVLHVSQVTNTHTDIGEITVAGKRKYISEWPIAC